MMAIQFPNFLNAQTAKPDYSGLADIVSNYYAGKQMPKDDLIKQIQAEFARPTAEQSLTHSKLANQQLRQSINKAAREMQEQAQLQAMLKQALSRGGQGDNYAQPMQQAPNINPQMAAALQSQQFETKLTPEEEQQFQSWKQQYAPNDSGMDYDLRGAFKAGLKPDPKSGHFPDTFKKPNHPTFSNQSIYASQVPEKAGSWQGEQYIPPQSQPEAFQESIISKGSPHLYAVDEMYDRNPLSRAFLEKQGLKKKQEVKFDNKTGRTNIITTYPSGKVTIQSTGISKTDEGIPLTNAMITQHQKVIAGVDNVIPVLEKILELGGGEKLDEKGMPAGKNKNVLQPYPRSSGLKPGMGWIPGWMSDATNYESLVTSAAEPLVKALGYPSTNEGLEKAVKQVMTSHGERNHRYIKRIRDLIEELKKKKEYSEKEIKRSNKIQPVARSSQLENMTDEELENIANG